MARVKKLWNDPSDEWSVERFGILYGQRKELIWDKIIDDIKIEIIYEELFYQKKVLKVPDWIIKISCWNDIFDTWEFETLIIEYDSIKNVNQLINQITEFGLTIPIK